MGGKPIILIVYISIYLTCHTYWLKYNNMSITNNNIYHKLYRKEVVKFNFKRTT